MQSVECDTHFTQSMAGQSYRFFVLFVCLFVFFCFCFWGGGVAHAYNYIFIICKFLKFASERWNKPALNVGLKCTRLMSGCVHTRQRHTLHRVVCHSRPSLSFTSVRFGCVA